MLNGPSRGLAALCATLRVDGGRSSRRAGQRSPRLTRIAATTALAGSFGLAAVASLPGSAAAATTTEYVSTTGVAGASDASCSSAGFSSINTAITDAASGDTVMVCPGTYHEAVSISGKVIHLVGEQATIAPTASPPSQGVVIDGSATSGSSLRGFTITGAQLEGVLVEATSDVSIVDNNVTANDQACMPQSGTNDCGEGLHLRAVSDSSVLSNTVSHNTGGIHITDGVPSGSIGATAFGYTSPSGPSYGNLIAGNRVIDNVWDCGISLPSHNSFAVNASPGIPGTVADGAPGTSNPTLGGVYDNTITENVIVGNGTASPGAGVLFAAPFPGTASYGNTATDNVILNNGNSGVTIHSHAPFQDVNGNVIENNQIGRNNLLGDSDAGDPLTTGVLVFSDASAGASPVQGTVITNNHIVNDTDGIFLANASGTTTTPNHYSAVHVDVQGS